MNQALAAKKQEAVVHEAVTVYFESPKVVKLATEFAEQQGQTLMHYNPRERMFTLADGEPYTAGYIVKHMTGDEI